jgi:hypothetical protein
MTRRLAHEDNATPDIRRNSPLSLLNNICDLDIFQNLLPSRVTRRFRVDFLNSAPRYQTKLTTQPPNTRVPIHALPLLVALRPRVNFIHRNSSLLPSPLSPPPSEFISPSATRLPDLFATYFFDLGLLLLSYHHPTSQASSLHLLPPGRADRV